MDKQFRPYIITSNSPMGLRLTLPRWRLCVGIIAWRVLPLLILLLLTFLGITESNRFPMYINAGLIFIGLVAMYMFTIKIIVGVTINSTFIELRTFGIFGERTSECYISQSQFIEIHISDHARGGAISYKLLLKNKKSVLFMQQPTQMAKRQEMEVVASALRDLTNLETKVKGRFRGEL